MSPLLNLADADTSGFAALPSGSYHCEVFSASMVETAGKEGAKLPPKTPGINFQFKVLGKVGEEVGEDSPYYNRRVFRAWYIPPEKGYDKAKGQKMKGMIVRLFTSLGYPEDEVIAGDFDPDLEELAGRPCTVSVKRKPKYGVNMDDPTIPDDEKWDNEVSGVRAAGSEVAAGSSLL